MANYFYKGKEVRSRSDCDRDVKLSWTHTVTLKHTDINFGVTDSVASRRSCRGKCGTKVKNSCVLVLCPVVSHDVVSYHTCVNLSLVHTCATRHDTTACDTTGQSTKTRPFFSLVPHIPRHDHAT